MPKPTERLDAEKLVQVLVDRGALRSPRIIRAFQDIHRADFTPPELRDRAYADTPLPIGHGQTISQPYVVAFMIELLAPRENDRILDVGSGSGWTTALLARLAPQGKVYGVERIPELAATGKEHLQEYKMKNASIVGAGRTMGLPAEAPFDRILVSAAAPDMPDELLRQLAPGGRMVLPIRNSVWKVDKDPSGHSRAEEFYGFAFVPLIG